MRESVTIWTAYPYMGQDIPVSMTTRLCKGWIRDAMYSIGPRFAGYVGLISLAQFLICIFIGGFTDENWVLFEDTLCYMGVSDISFIRVMYPITCTLMGLGAAIFGCIVARSSTRKLQVIGYYMCIPFGIFLSGIGIITIDMQYTLHMVCVYLMGASAGFVMGLTSIDDFKNGNKLTLPFFIFLLVGFLYFTFFDMRFQQPFVYLGMFIWLIGKCYHLISTDSAY